MKSTHRIVPGAAVTPITLAAVAGLAAAGNAPVEVIYSEVVTSDTSLVPGLDGARFDSFDRPTRSPDGTRWILTASSDLATSMDEVLLTGMVDGPGMLQVQEGTAAPWAKDENVGLLNGGYGINDAGMWIFGTNTDGPTSADEYIVMFDGSVFSVVAQEGNPVPGYEATEVYGSTLDSALITNAGAGFRANATVGDLPSDQDNFLIFAGGIQAQAGVGIPAGQAGGAMEFYENFDLTDYFVSGDAMFWAAQGDLTGTTSSDDVFIVGGSVVVQEDSPVGGLAGTVSTISTTYLSPVGDWFARGSNDGGQDWIVGGSASAGAGTELIAATGDEVPGGLPGETFSDAIFSSTFFSMFSNNAGDYVYAGTTSNPDEFGDAVYVLNGEEVVLRQGDVVNFPDGSTAFINIFNNDDGFLTDELVMYFTATLQDEGGADLGQALLRVDLGGTTADCDGNLDGDGDVDTGDLLILLGSWGECPPPPAECIADIDGNGSVDTEDLLTLLAMWGECPL